MARVISVGVVIVASVAVQYGLRQLTSMRERDAMCSPPPPNPHVQLDHEHGSAAESYHTGQLEARGYTRVARALPAAHATVLRDELWGYLRSHDRQGFYSRDGCIGDLGACALRFDVPLPLNVTPTLNSALSSLAPLLRSLVGSEGEVLHHHHHHHSPITHHPPPPQPPCTTATTHNRHHVPPPPRTTTTTATTTTNRW